jgi:hypothetical protein
LATIRPGRPVAALVVVPLFLGREAINHSR